ncbi:MAG: epoxyqueuosine reductase QueH [Eubacteriales bacterium]|nr:epoxyqueuosine reductase QueH [Eubacteriales bacterium]
MNQRNYQRELDKILAGLAQKEQVPVLFLHSCCAPCSSYVLEYLSKYFQITVFYYNPNIYPREEYEKRVQEQKRFIRELPAEYPISFMEGEFDDSRFYECTRGMEKEPEGGARCLKCYRLRLEETARLAAVQKADFFASTLTISPLKNAGAINEIGEALALEYGVSWLPSDFKKKNGFKRSGELSREYGLYRQNYCGCVFSKRPGEPNNA